MFIFTFAIFNLILVQFKQINIYKCLYSKKKKKKQLGCGPMSKYLTE